MDDEPEITLEQYHQNTDVLEEGFHTLDEVSQYFLIAVQQAFMLIPSEDEEIPAEIIDMADRWDEEIAQFLAKRAGGTLIDGKLNTADSKAVYAEVAEIIDAAYSTPRFIFIEGEDPRDSED